MIGQADPPVGYSQIDGNLATVAAGMKLNGTPNDLIQNLNPIAIIIMVPFFDYVVYPLLRRWRINFTPIKRIYAGFLVAGLGESIFCFTRLPMLISMEAMVYSAVLQHYIYLTSPCHDNLPSECKDAAGNPDASNINVWVVSGPYILVALSEIFASITSIEYAFTKVNIKLVFQTLSSSSHFRRLLNV